MDQQHTVLHKEGQEIVSQVHYIAVDLCELTLHGEIESKVMFKPEKVCHGMKAEK